MSEHCTIISLAWCRLCGQFTMHLFEAHGVKRCLEHEPQRLTQKQVEDRERRAREPKQGALFQ